MKKHLPLPIPSDSAWERRTWKYYTPIWFNEIVTGISNLIKWTPTIYKDRDWDDHYIFEMLKFKFNSSIILFYLTKDNTNFRETDKTRLVFVTLFSYKQQF